MDQDTILTNQHVALSSTSTATEVTSTLHHKIQIPSTVVETSEDAAVPMTSRDAITQDASNTSNTDEPLAAGSAAATDDADELDDGLDLGTKRRRSEACMRSRELKKARKKQRNLVERNMGTKQDYFDVFGYDVAASLALKEDAGSMLPRAHIKVRDLHSLILWCLAEAVNPHWVFVKHRPLVEHAVVVVVDGLSHAIVKKHENHLPFLHQMSLNGAPLNLQVPCSLFASTCVLQHFLTCTIDRVKGATKPQLRVGSQVITGSSSRSNHHHHHHHHQHHEKKSGDGSNSSSDTRNSKTNQDKLGPLAYLATEADLQVHGFPIPGGVGFESFVCTRDEITQDGSGEETKMAVPATPRSLATMIRIPGEPDIAANDYSLLRALDCEMVLTASGYSLARMSLLDGEANVLVDVLVAQSEPVIDYLTKYSGITEDLLTKNPTVTFQEAQDLFLTHVSARHILVGHSVENDLKSLRVIHARILDTSLLYPHPRQQNYKSSLKYLANKFLNINIRQNGTEAGHDSIEDSRVALELARLKLQQGPEFGIHVTAGDALFDIMSRLDKSTCLVAPVGVCRRYAGDRTNAIGTTSDEDTVRRVVNELHRIRRKVEHDYPSELKTDHEDNLHDASIAEKNEDENASEDSFDSDSDASLSDDDDDEDDSGLRDNEKMAGAPADLLVAHLPELFSYLDDFQPGVRRGVGAAQHQESKQISSGANSNATTETDANTTTTMGTSGIISVPLEPLGELNLAVPEPKDPTEVLANINRQIEKIWDACPRNTLVLVMSGQASVAAAKRITHVVTQLKRHQVSQTGETYEEVTRKIAEGDSLLRSLINANQEGVVFMNVKS